MAIQFLKVNGWLPLLLLFVGCEKWADGVVRDIEFPEHTAEISASGTFISGDSKAILSVNSTSSLQTPSPIVLPEGANASLRLNGEEILVWDEASVDVVGEPWNAVEMLVLTLDAPLDLAPGLYELAVNVPGEDPLTASAIQPPTPQFTQEFELNADSIVDYWGMVYYDELLVSLSNRPSVQDVYGLRLEEGLVYGSDTTWSNVFGDDIQDPRVKFSIACRCFLVDDQDIDGQQLDDIRLSRSRYDEGYYGGGSDDVVLRLTVDLMSPSLGDFYRSVDVHEAANDNFFANPSGIYSNTSSGFGHFGLVSRVMTMVN
jgi:hypothetical protein